MKSNLMWIILGAVAVMFVTVSGINLEGVEFDAESNPVGAANLVGFAYKGSSVCDDSDGGLDYDNYGCVRGYKGKKAYSYCDKCLKGKYGGYVKEYYCRGSRPSAKKYDCGECVNGACVSEAFPCIDSDGGQIAGEAGIVSAGDQIFSDRCFSQWEVEEGYCENNGISTIRLYCYFGCKDGACQSQQECDCLDDDDGQDPMVFGVTTRMCYAGGSHTTEEFADYCIDDWNLEEFYCDMNIVESYAITCYYGCRNGACLVTEGCFDNDGDGYGVSGSQGCPRQGIDCNDADPTVYPGAQEFCDNVDNDCDNIVDEGCQCINGDHTVCGTTDIGECEYGYQYCYDGQWGPCEGAIYPSTEVCDGLDNDCDGTFDEQLNALACNYQFGVCAGSQKRCGGTSGWLTCGPAEFGPNFESIETSCDGLDNDCDGMTDEQCQCIDGDQHACGVTSIGDCKLGVEVCTGGQWGPCVGVVYPSTEVCDGRDNDCDGTIDEELNAPACNYQFGVCAGSQKRCGGISGWLNCGPMEYGPSYEPVETSCDNLDNDCDGQTDEYCQCVDGQQQQCGTTDIGECHYGVSTCVGGEWGLCYGALHAVQEICDGRDNDCDGTIDEQLRLSCVLQLGVCTGSVRVCGGSSGWLQCGSSQYGPNFESIETSCDNLDNDCDGIQDEGCQCVDGQQQLCGQTNVGECEWGQQTCYYGNWTQCQGAVYPSPEICDNLDNDCDGATDEVC